ncbi:MAG: DUF4397 domain-containing protein [Niabella sp.]
MKLQGEKFYTLAAVLGLGLLSATFTSCDLHDDDYYDLPPAANVDIIHSSPKAPYLDASFDANRLYLNYFDYLKHTGYQRAWQGNRTFTVYYRNSGMPIVEKSISLQNDKHYSVFITDTLSKTDIVLLRDSTRYASGDSLRIRFANMSPDVPAMDFYIQGKDEPVATNVPYKQAVDFASLKAANNVVFEARAAGQSTVLATSVKTDLVPQGVYTVWTSGFKGATDDARVTIGRMRHSWRY